MRPIGNSIRSAAALVAAVAAQEAAHNAAAHHAATQAQQAATQAQVAPLTQGSVTPQGGSAGVQVRKATAAEKLQSQRVMDPLAHNPGVDPAIERGLARVGHKFHIVVRPDGTVVHEYGKDVAPELREVVLGAARRHSVTGGTQAP